MIINVDELADIATVIVEGYAFVPMGDDYWQVVNLYNPKQVAVIYDDEIHETNMSDIELDKVMQIYLLNKEFLISE